MLSSNHFQQNTLQRSVSMFIYIFTHTHKGLLQGLITLNYIAQYDILSSQI